MVCVQFKILYSLVCMQILLEEPASGCDNKVRNTEVLGEFQPQVSKGGEVCLSVSVDVQS